MCRHANIVVHVLNTLIPVGAKPALQQAATVSVVHKVSLPGLVRTYVRMYVRMCCTQASLIKEKAWPCTNVHVYCTHLRKVNA